MQMVLLSGTRVRSLIERNVVPALILTLRVPTHRSDSAMATGSLWENVSSPARTDHPLLQLGARDPPTCTTDGASCTASVARVHTPYALPRACTPPCQWHTTFAAYTDPLPHCPACAGELLVAA